MMHRTTVTLSEEAFAFLNAKPSNGRSAYINQLLLDEKRKTLQQALLLANQEEAEDIHYQKNLSEWDGTLSDGLEV